jgi:hypothetical protein
VAAARGGIGAFPSPAASALSLSSPTVTIVAAAPPAPMIERRVAGDAEASVFFR